MPPSPGSIGELLAALTEVARSFESLAEELRELAWASSVRQALEFRKYEAATAIEGFVDVEMRNGDALTWWLECVPQDGKWVVSGALLHIEAGVQKPAVTLPDITAGSDAELVSALPLAARKLIAISPPAGLVS